MILDEVENIFFQNSPSWAGSRDLISLDAVLVQQSLGRRHHECGRIVIAAFRGTLFLGGFFRAAFAFLALALGLRFWRLRFA